MLGQLKVNLKMYLAGYQFDEFSPGHLKKFLFTLFKHAWSVFA